MYTRAQFYETPKRRERCSGLRQAANAGSLEKEIALQKKKKKRTSRNIAGGQYSSTSTVELVIAACLYARREGKGVRGRRQIRGERMYTYAP